MNIIVKALRRIGFYITTELARVYWGNKLIVEGVLKKRFDTQIIISDAGKMHIGSNVCFQKRVALTSVGGELNIGSNVSFNRNCILICRYNITIDDNVIFGPGVTIYDHDHVFSAEGIMPGFRYGSVIIEQGCWIGANVIILRDSHIGKGSVIGAGSIVKGNIPPHSLVTSNRDMNIVSISDRKDMNRLE